MSSFRGISQETVNYLGANYEESFSFAAEFINLINQFRFRSLRKSQGQTGMFQTIGALLGVSLVSLFKRISFG